MADDDFEVTRREFVEGVGALGVATAATSSLLNVAHAVANTTSTPVVARGGVSRIALSVNGQSQEASISPDVTLLDLLREQLQLTGTKKGCNQGGCGACTVWVDGERVNACMTLAIMQEGREVRTIEGLADGEDLHPLQTAFVENDAFQCGFCTSGQIMSGARVLQDGLPETDEALCEAMNGNICRCSAYPQIRAAMRDAAKEG